MKQLVLLTFPRPTMREFVAGKLRDFTIRQQARAAKRAESNDRRKRGIREPENKQENMFPCE